MSSLDDSMPSDGADQEFAGPPAAYAEALSLGGTTLAEPETSRGAPAVRAASSAGAPLRRILEAILFATDRPVTTEQLLCALPAREVEEVETELERMAQEYAERDAGFRLVAGAGGYQIRTDPEMHEYVTRFLVGKKRARLSRAAMETLAIIAYRQPITRGECEDIRGVDSGQVLHTLLERDLVAFRGRSQALGRPHLYGTSEEFLRSFGLNSLADLPSPEELQSLLGEDPLADPEIAAALRARGFGDEAPEGPGEDRPDGDPLGGDGLPGGGPGGDPAGADTTG
jgi:segregation and condensation protein B